MSTSNQQTLVDSGANERPLMLEKGNYISWESKKDGRLDIQTKNSGYGGNGNKNAGRQNRNQIFNARNGNDESNQMVQCILQTDLNSAKASIQCYNCNEKAMKDEYGSNLNDEENDLMLDNSFEDETLEELTATVIMMA
nr:hypothetical protein [Tanacetum cinerariifolium]GEY37720.1 hypothetical protein [Tanacetum cinerariifolium]